MSEKFLGELKNKTDVEEVIGSYVALKRRGTKAVGLCPFHSEKTPSFTVFPDTQSYYCFGCGAGGDVITFLMTMENLTYPEAVEQLAKRAGMAMPEPERGGGEDLKKKRLRLFDLNRDAARFFHQTLLEPQAKPALDYLLGRALTMRTIKHFGLGFASDDWDSLLKHLTAKGYTREELREAGLCSRSKSGSFYDYFRNRVIFPIIDVRGGVIGFGGRVMDQSLPKYLNSPDTLVFKKSSNLYGLNFAKANAKQRLILTEGYMDTIALHQAGFENALATLGTAITQEHARLMARYTKEVLIAYDSDAAGQKATDKAIEYLGEVGIKVKVIRMTGGKDPDEYIKTFGRDKFNQLIEGSGSHIEYKLAKVSSKYDIHIDEQRVEYLKETVQILSAIESPIEREVYAARIARETGVDKAAVNAEVARARKAFAKKTAKNMERREQEKLFSRRDKINPEKEGALKAAKSEEGLLCILFFHPDYAEEIREAILPQDFVTSFNRRVFESICGIIDRAGVPDTTLLGQEFSPEEMGAIGGILALHETIAGTRQEAAQYIQNILAEKSRRSLKAADLKAEELTEYIRRKAEKQERKE
ncbi:DNA primase [Clostridiales bacterium BX7]|uniref:DNA primase n=1 Tax=Feifania hominis TaxID=2763660 RepID=A0A926DBY4_9FIRM|nr:DNA primase [Feifania hominis]